MNLLYSDLQLWAELLDYTCERSQNGKVYLGTAFEVKEFDDVEAATKYLLPMFLQGQAS